MRFHIGAAAFVIWIMRFYDLAGADRAVLFMCIGSVIGLELVNTAVENTVDLACAEKNDRAKKAKDCAAGAVLICAAASVLCAYEILWDAETLGRIWRIMTDKPYRLVIFAVLTVLWWLWVFWPRNDKREVSENEQ